MCKTSRNNSSQIENTDKQTNSSTKSSGSDEISQKVISELLDDLIPVKDDGNYIYFAGKNTQIALARAEFRKKDLDGSIYLKVKDKNGNSGELHWGEKSESKYVLSMKQGKLQGRDRRSNLHFKEADGSLRTEYMGGYSLIRKLDGSGKEYFLSKGPAAGEFFLSRRSKGSDLEICSLPGTGSESISDLIRNQEKLKFDKFQQNEMLAYRNRLINASENADTFEYLKLQKDMLIFEKRLQGLSQAGSETERRQQGRQLYGTLLRLLRAPCVPGEQQLKLSMQIISQCADPSSINQGAHPTCTVAALESRIYARYPAQAARFVVDLASSGQYLSQRNAILVQIDRKSQVPDYYSSGAVEDGERSYASKLFQIGAANLPHAKSKDNVSYMQPASNKNGEGLYETKNGKQKFLVDSTCLSDADLELIGAEISGTDQSGSALTHVTAFSYGRNFGKNELQRILEDAKRKNNFPLLISVNCAKEPFKSASGNDKDSWHEASIHDYDPRSARCAIDNQWGKHNDHIKVPISVDMLYDSMLPQNKK